MYHLSNTIAVVEYLLTLYLKPALKTYTTLPIVGASHMCMIATHLFNRFRHGNGHLRARVTIRRNDSCVDQLFSFSSLSETPIPQTGY